MRPIASIVRWISDSLRLAKAIPQRETADDFLGFGERPIRHRGVAVLIGTRKQFAPAQPWSVLSGPLRADSSSANRR